MRNREGEVISRSASFSYHPETTEASPQPRLRRNFSENVLFEPQGQNTAPSSPAVAKELFRRASKNTRKRLSEVHVTSLAAENQDAPVDISCKADAEQTDRAKGLGRSVSGTIKGLARRSWLPLTPKLQFSLQQESSRPEKKNSRSPQKESPPALATIAIPAPVASRSSSRSSNHDEENGIHQEVSRTQRQAPPLDSRSVSSNLLSVDGQTETETGISRTPSTVSVHSKRSLDPPANMSVSHHLSPIPVSLSSDRLSTASADSTRRKDPLWGAFRALEGELLRQD